MGVEVSPAGDSQANGDVERAIRTVKGQIRILKGALDGNYKTEFGENRAVMPWLIAYSSSPINKFTVDTAGNTAHDRCRGRKFAKVLPEFGECVCIARRNLRKGASDLEPRWGSCIFLDHQRIKSRANYLHAGGSYQGARV